MARPQVVTFTGPDDQSDFAALYAFQQKHPVIEWGILVLPEYTGQPRYPTPSAIQRFIAQCPGRKALHVCKGDVHRFIKREPALWALAQQFDRVQVNFFQQLDPIDPRELSDTILAYGKPVIMPYNKGNAQTNAKVTAPHDVIFDASGGTGTSPRSWPASLSNRFCTYAGGLGPENIHVELKKISAAAQGQSYGIDMESRIRDTQARLCQQKMEAVIAACYSVA